MRKIRIIEHLSLDGVIQAPGGLEEAPGYPYGGWAAPHDDPAGGEAIVAAHGEDFDLLLGRQTYDIWSGFWPNAPKSPMAATKYVATRRPDSLAWGPAEGLGYKRFSSDVAPPRELALVSTKAVSSASSSAPTGLTVPCGQAPLASEPMSEIMGGDGQ